MNHAVLGDAGYPGATGAALLGSLNALHLNVALLDNAQPVPRGISLIRLFGSGGAGSLKLAHSSKRVLGETVVVVNESDRRVAVAGLERTAGKPDYQVGSKRCAAFRLLPTGKMTRGWFPGADGAPAAEAAYYAAGLHSGLARAVMGADSIRTFQDLAAPPAQTQLRHVISVVPNPPRRQDLRSHPEGRPRRRRPACHRHPEGGGHRRRQRVPAKEAGTEVDQQFRRLHRLPCARREDVGVRLPRPSRLERPAELSTVPTP